MDWIHQFCCHFVAPLIANSRRSEHLTEFEHGRLEDMVAGEYVTAVQGSAVVAVVLGFGDVSHLVAVKHDRNLCKFVFRVGCKGLNIIDGCSYVISIAKF